MKKVLPPTYFFLYLVSAILLHKFFPIKPIINSPYSYSGVLFLMVGIGLNLWTDSVLKRNNTTVKPFDKPSVLITTEAFRFSRHPMYLGFVLILLGVGILFGSLSALLPSILMFLTLKVVFISQEEENLEKQFGKTYKSYQRRVRCWI